MGVNVGRFEKLLNEYLKGWVKKERYLPYLSLFIEEYYKNVTLAYHSWIGKNALYDKFSWNLMTSTPNKIET